MSNAIHHGNRGDPSKRIQLSLSVNGNTLHLSVADEGEGFDWSQVRRSPLAASTIPCGRGLPLIASIAPRVSFNGKGNLIKVEICGKKLRGER